MICIFAYYKSSKIMNILDKFFRNRMQQDNNNEKVIDLSDSSQYPASVLANLDFTFALGDDSQNFLTFLHGKWKQPTFKGVGIENYEGHQCSRGTGCAALAVEPDF